MRQKCVSHFNNRQHKYRQNVEKILPGEAMNRIHQLSLVGFEGCGRT
jgi:hypothetical protein